MVTLVFDDKLMVVRGHAFHSGVEDPEFVLLSPGWLEHGIKFDLRELTKESLAENLYSQITRFGGDSRRAIVDDESRKRRLLKKYKPVEE